MNTRVAATAALVCLAVQGDAAAQAASRQGEVVVTGRGRAEAAFAAPAAVTVLTAGALDARGVASVDDLAVAAPGLHVINDQDPGTNIVALRGATTDRLQQGAVAFLIDGLPLGDTEFFTARLTDVAAIEVLRGPQGALLGKNAAGGAINVVTAAPGPTPEARLRLGLGDGGLREGEATAGLPLAGAAGWAARGALSWTAADGWIVNRTLGRVVDATETQSARLALAGPIGPRLTLDARLFWLEEDGGAAWASSNNVIGRFGGRLSGAALTDPIGDVEGRAWRRWLRASAHAAWRADGGGELHLRAARDSYQKRWTEELDYRPGPLTFFGAPLFPQGLQPIRQPTDLQVWTGEARYLSAEDRRLRWTAGAFVQDVTRGRVDDFGPLLFGAAPPRYRTTSLQTAAFAGLAYDAADGLTLEAQLRLDRDARRQIVTDGASGRTLSDARATFERLQPRLAGAWRPTRDLTVYAAYGEGFRTGGFNPTPGPGAIWRARFAPETTRSLEAGVKRRGLPRDGRAEAAVFATRTSDYQNYTFLDGQSVTLTVDAVETWGVELSGGLAPARGWRLDGAFALARAEVARFVAPDPLVAGATRDYSGRRVPNQPLWTATAGPSWREVIGGVLVTARLDLNATGATVYEIDNRLRSPPKAWADARLTAGRGAWTGEVWGRNLSDERWAISAFGQTMLPLLAGLGPGGPFDTFTVNRGRQWGARVTLAY